MIARTPGRGVDELARNAPVMRVGCAAPSRSGRAPVQHFGMIYGEWKKIGKVDGRFALAPGTRARATVPVRAAGARISWTKPLFWGRWFGEPLEVTPAHTVDLEYRSLRKLFIEGFIDLEERAPEGSVLEKFHGYLLPERPAKELVGHVTAHLGRAEPDSRGGAGR